MAKITFENKEDLNITEVAQINKVTASDINEIKTVVNGLDDLTATNQEDISVNEQNIADNGVSIANNLINKLDKTDFNLPIADENGITQFELNLQAGEKLKLQGGVFNGAEKIFTVSPVTRNTFYINKDTGTASGQFQNPDVPFQTLDQVHAVIPNDLQFYTIVFQVGGSYPCNFIADRNLIYSSDYLVDIDFTNSSEIFVNKAINKTLIFKGGNISLKTDKITSQQFSTIDVGGANRVIGHINELKWNASSSNNNNNRGLFRFQNNETDILIINKINTYDNNGSSIVYAVNNGKSTKLIIGEASILFNSFLTLNSGGGNLNLTINNITGVSDLNIKDVNNLKLLNIEKTNKITFNNVIFLDFDNTFSNSSIIFDNVNIITGVLNSTVPNTHGNKGCNNCNFINFVGNLDSLSHYGGEKVYFKNSIITVNSKLLNNAYTDIEERMTFEGNCVIKSNTTGDIFTGVASSIFIYGELHIDSDNILGTQIRVIKKTINI